MGTSKGYIAPTRPEWRNAKRAVSTYLRSRDPETRAKAVSKYAEAMRTRGAANSRSSAFGASFSSAAGNVISFARGLAENGLEKTLNRFGRDDLIGKSPDSIIHELLDQFTNHGSSIEDSLTLNAVSTAFNVLAIETPDDLAKMDLDAFLLELVIAFVNNDFDLRFFEKINRGRTPEETKVILEDVHGYIDGMLRNKLTRFDISSIDLSQMSSDKFVSEMLDDALYTCMNIYGVED